MRILTRLKNTFTLVILCSLSATAQKSFKYQAALRGVDRAGFYKIYLEPELVAKCKSDLSDLRIVNSSGAFTPFIATMEMPTNTTNFINFPKIALSSTDKDTATIIVVENKSLMSINSMWLRLKNTAVERHADLLGSDDLKNWFAIEEKIPLQPAINNTDVDNYFQKLSFPVSAYKYFKIIIGNRKKNPINILGVGIYDSRYSPGKFIAVPEPKMIRKDSSNRITYLRLKFKDPFRIDKLHLDIVGPKYFVRQALIYTIDKQHKEQIGSVELNSGKSTSLLVSAKTNQIELHIFNEDNPPLAINKIAAFQMSQYIIAYLEQAETYRLVFSDAKATPPQYDLDFFTDSALNNPIEIRHEAILANSVYQINPVKTKKDLTPFLWIAIILAVGLLMLLTWRMLNEIKKT